VGSFEEEGAPGSTPSARLINYLCLSDPIATFPPLILPLVGTRDSQSCKLGMR
jgi:hypothetical protein